MAQSHVEIKVEREILFEDTLTVNSIEYTKFERTPRLFAKGEFTDGLVDFDVNVEAYPIDIQDRLNVAIYNNVSPSGSVLSDFYDHDPRILGTSIMDEYEYVCHGKVYKRVGPKDGKEGQITIWISFGGLLMKIRCSNSHVKGLDCDNYCYLLIRKE